MSKRGAEGQLRALREQKRGATDIEKGWRFIRIFSGVLFVIAFLLSSGATWVLLRGCG